MGQLSLMPAAARASPRTGGRWRWGTHAVSELTGVGVVHVSVIHQHFVKEDDAPIAGERLLGEPRRERHQRRHWNPWRGHGAFTGVRGQRSGPGARRLVCQTGQAASPYAVALRW